MLTRIQWQSFLPHRTSREPHFLKCHLHFPLLHLWEWHLNLGSNSNPSSGLSCSNSLGSGGQARLSESNFSSLSVTPGDLLSPPAAPTGEWIEAVLAALQVKRFDLNFQPKSFCLITLFFFPVITFDMHHPPPTCPQLCSILLPLTHVSAFFQAKQ